MKLHYKHFGQGKPLIILHGLMGALDNWQTLAKVFAEQYSVFIIDQRNHGKSPHSNDFNYDVMAKDLLEFMDEHKISSCYLLGHSMGGKVAMHFALLHPEKVEKLIAADIAPVMYEDRHTYIIDALKSVPLGKVNSREEVQEILSTKIHELSTVLFLMKGLYRDEQNKFQWRFNIAAIEKNYELIADFPDHSNSFDKPTLFIKGDRSDYINGVNYASIVSLFPENELEEINDAGHWLHADQPAVFVEIAMKFLSK